MAAGFAYFASFLKTADEFARFGKTQLPMPVTVRHHAEVMEPHDAELRLSEPLL